MLKRTFTCFQNSKGSFFGGKDIKKKDPIWPENK